MKVLKTAKLTGFELYNLAGDVAEATDVAASEPERFAALKQKLIATYEEVQEESPVLARMEIPALRRSTHRMGPNTSPSASHQSEAG